MRAGELKPGVLFQLGGENWVEGVIGNTTFRHIRVARHRWKTGSSHATYDRGNYAHLASRLHGRARARLTLPDRVGREQ